MCQEWNSNHLGLGLPTERQGRGKQEPLETPANWVLMRSSLCEHWASTVYIKESLQGHRRGNGAQEKRLTEGHRASREQAFVSCPNSQDHILVCHRGGGTAKTQSLALL